MSHEVINPARLGEPKGWNNGMLAPTGGRILFIAGQTAPRDATGRVTTEGFVEQFAGALDAILAVLTEAGGVPEDIGRMTVFVTDMQAYKCSLRTLGRAYRERMGRHYPAMALLEVKGLVDDNALVEIEATAVIPPPSRLQAPHRPPVQA